MNPMMNIPPLNNDEISITILSNIKCKKNDKASILDKYQNFTYNFKPILFDKTFEENGIQNGSIINLTDKIYVLSFDLEGYIINVNLDGNCTFKQAIYFYCQRYKNQNLYQQVLNGEIIFIWNNFKLNIEDETSLKIFFRDTKNPSIIVHQPGNIIGG